MEGVRNHSARYARFFRDLSDETYTTLKRSRDLIMEEHAIVDAATLPADHLRRPPESGSRVSGRLKWEQTMAALKSRDRQQHPNLFNDVLFILQHNDWYTKEAYVLLRQLCDGYPFTAKQRNRIRNPPALQQEEDYDDYGDFDDDCNSHY